VGVLPSSTGGGKVGAAALRMAGVVPASTADMATLFERLRAKGLDAIVVLAEVGNPALVAALNASDLALWPLSSSMATTGDLEMPPYLRSARIPPGSYRGQAEAIETFGVQVVLAAPARRDDLQLSGGHAAALQTVARPLAPAEVEAMVEATRFPEPPDPVLPSAWTGGSSSSDSGVAQTWVDPLLNALLLLFLGWLVLSVVRPPRDDVLAP
jgi:hypothetical protein